MFSAFKRLAGKIDNGIPNYPPSHQTMPGSLQKKFSRGVQYNMKIIIKGDRNVGKSCLLERLQGKGFIEEYAPTDQIQVASIQWAFKATDDIVKVEVWDVVDRGKSRPQTSGLKLSLATGAVDVCTPALDAEFLDVYKGTHGVILMMDITKNWTFEYICKELEKVPEDLPVLILGNHCDMSHHRVVTNGQVTGFIENFVRAGDTLYAESSMRNGFGLHLLHRFLGLPFLRLQKLSIELMLERNKKDTEITKEEIQLFQQSDESNYNKFLENLVKKRRQVADHNAKVANPHNAVTLSPAQENINETKMNSAKCQSTIIIGAGHPIIVEGKPNIQNTDTLKFSQIPNVTNNHVLAQSHAPNSSSEGTTKHNKNTLNMDNNRNNLANSERKQDLRKAQLSSKSQVDTVEDFCPDDSLDKSFLDDLTTSNDHDIKQDSDSDVETGNPLVATFQDEMEDLHETENIGKLNETVKKFNSQDTIKLKTKAMKLDLCDNENVSEFKISPSLDKDDKFELDSLKSEELEGDFGSDDWMSASKIRRSPEGGEDSTGTCSINQGLIETEKKEKRPKKSKKSKDKVDKDKKKHKKGDRKKDELEHFLNGPSGAVPEIEAYEAL